MKNKYIKIFKIFKINLKQTKYLSDNLTEDDIKDVYLTYSIPLYLALAIIVLIITTNLFYTMSNIKSILLSPDNPNSTTYLINKFNSITSYDYTIQDPNKMPSFYRPLYERYQIGRISQMTEISVNFTSSKIKYNPTYKEGENPFFPNDPDFNTDNYEYKTALSKLGILHKVPHDVPQLSSFYFKDDNIHVLHKYIKFFIQNKIYPVYIGKHNIILIDNYDFDYIYDRNENPWYHFKTAVFNTNMDIYYRIYVDPASSVSYNLANNTKTYVLPKFYYYPLPLTSKNDQFIIYFVHVLYSYKYTIRLPSNTVAVFKAFIHDKWFTYLNEYDFIFVPKANILATIHPISKLKNSKTFNFLPNHIKNYAYSNKLPPDTILISDVVYRKSLYYKPFPYPIYILLDTTLTNPKHLKFITKYQPTKPHPEYLNHKNFNLITLDQVKNKYRNKQSPEYTLFTKALNDYIKHGIIPNY